MKSRIAAMRALVYDVAATLDRSLHEVDAEARARAEGRLALLTPVVKAWCSNHGFEIASIALQVHGGMGYIEETGAAQHLRDARINMIYEGTNGVQALDLVERKLAWADGRLPWTLFGELHDELAALEASGAPDLRAPLGAALDALEQATRWLQGEHGDDPDARAAGATPYLELFGTTAGGFLLARAARVAHAADDPGARSRHALAAFYAGQLLPQASAVLPAITAGPRPLDALAG